LAGAGVVAGGSAAGGGAAFGSVEGALVVADAAGAAGAGVGVLTAPLGAVWSGEGVAPGAALVEVLAATEVSPTVLEVLCLWCERAL
jgi:hypothetical protein